MKRHPMQWWKLAAPALLLAGITWSGVAAAQKKGDDRFDGPGGMSAPADPKDEKEGKKEGRRGRHGAMRRHHGDMMAELDLSDRQKEQIRGIRQAQERRMIPLNADLKTAGLDLRELMQAERPNQARIDAAIDKLADLRADAHKERVKSMLAIRDVLTDEQRKKLKEARGGRGFGMRGMHRMGMGMGMHGSMHGAGDGMDGHHGMDI